MKNKKNTASAKPALNQEENIGFSLSSILRNLKKYFLPWLILAVLVAGFSIGKNLIFSADAEALTATISFNYNGIEEGLDPNGCEFDTDVVKNDQVVSDALSALGLSDDLRETVQNSIHIDGIVSSAAIEKITQYSSIYSSSTSSWIETMHDTAYHPTQYRVSFNYSKTGLSGEQAAELINKILENYQNYFFETYGYSESVSNSVLAVNSDDYDYLIVLDMYNSTLKSLESYINRMAAADTSQFRSDLTGYSFADLADAIGLIRSVDIDTLTSYVLNNGVISNKEMMVSYYTYRIDDMTRSKANAEERMNAIQDSIDMYQKDAVLIYNNTEFSSASVTSTSGTYDALISQKIEFQSRVSYYDEMLQNYKDRLAAINQTKSSVTDAEKKYVDERIQVLEQKIVELTDNVKATADDYYENEKFTNAYSIITPASYSFTQYFKSVIDESMRLIIILELTLLTVYLFISIVACSSIWQNFKKKRLAKSK